MDKVYKGVTKKVSDAGGVSQWAFNTALDYGMQNYDAGGVGVNPILNMAFSSVQATLGGKIQLAVTGSAPLSPEIQKFMQTVLKAPVRYYRHTRGQRREVCRTATGLRHHSHCRLAGG